MTLPSPQPPQRTPLPPDDPRTKLRNAEAGEILDDVDSDEVEAEAAHLIDVGVDN